MQNNRIKKIGIVFIWLCIWQIVYFSIGKEILFVSPFGVLKTGWRLVQEVEFWKSIGASLFRIMNGFFFAVILGSITAIITSANAFFYDLFYPAISVLKATPVASFIILALVWMKTGQVPVFVSFLIVFPLVWGNVSQGIQSRDRNLLEMADVFSFSKKQRFLLIDIPSVLPYFTAACTTGLGLAWKSGIAAEVISMPQFSIGTALYQSKIYLETAELFTWTAVVIIQSVLLERLLVFLLKKVTKAYYKKEAI